MFSSISRGNLEAAQSFSGNLIIGNWKCHKSPDDAKKWFDDFSEKYSPKEGVRVVVAPPLLYLRELAAHLAQYKLENVVLAAQDVSPFPRGGYTGAVSADMLRGLVDYVIVGHTERRKYFHETTQDVSNKVLEVSEAGLIPIICLDTSYAMSQLAITNELDHNNVVAAYTPVDALSAAAAHPVERVDEFIDFVHEYYPKIPLVYGGAVSKKNAKTYLQAGKLSGLFVGGASLDPHHFAEICSVIS